MDYFEHKLYARESGILYSHKLYRSDEPVFLDTSIYNSYINTIGNTKVSLIKDNK